MTPRSSAAIWSDVFCCDALDAPRTRLLDMPRVSLALGLALGALGLFWAGRESSHGLSAFSEHWWCPIPLVAIFLGVLLTVAGRMIRPMPS